MTSHVDSPKAGTLPPSQGLDNLFIGIAGLIGAGKSTLATALPAGLAISKILPYFSPSNTYNTPPPPRP